MRGKQERFDAPRCGSEHHSVAGSVKQEGVGMLLNLLPLGHLDPEMEPGLGAFLAVPLPTSLGDALERFWEGGGQGLPCPMEPGVAAVSWGDKELPVPAGCAQGPHKAQPGIPQPTCLCP